MKNIENKKSSAVIFNLEDGISPDYESTKRMLSAMAGMYLNNEKLKEMISEKDILVYEFYELGIPEKPGDLAYGTTILYPGKVDNEYFMTKGHFHSKIDTAFFY